MEEDNKNLEDFDLDFDLSAALEDDDFENLEDFETNEEDEILNDSISNIVDNSFNEEETTYDEDNLDTEEEKVVEDGILTIDEKNSSIVNEDGELVVMDQNAKGQNFNVEYIPIENIAIVQRIRKTVNVDDLTESIRTTGLLMPIIVAPTSQKDLYVLIDGFRRVHACAKVGIREIPAIINNKVSTSEIPILEAMYNRNKEYSVKEIVDYIDYMEKEQETMSPATIEFLMQLNNGDYTKLKDILEDDDPAIVEKLMEGVYSIGQAFKKLEARRRKETKEEKELDQLGRVYGSEENKVNSLKDLGEEADEDMALSESEIQELAISTEDLKSESEKSLEELVETGEKIKGYEPHKQSTKNRETLNSDLRKAVLARDENTCKCCGVSGQSYISVLDIHHILPVFLGGTDKEDNLVPICLVCHKLVHKHARGELFLTTEGISEAEKTRFKQIILYGNVIRKAMEKRGMSLEQLKKEDDVEGIGRENYNDKKDENTENKTKKSKKSK